MRASSSSVQSHLHLNRCHGVPAPVVRDSSDDRIVNFKQRPAPVEGLGQSNPFTRPDHVAMRKRMEDVLLRVCFVRFSRSYREFLPCGGQPHRRREGTVWQAPSLPHEPVSKWTQPIRSPAKVCLLPTKNAKPESRPHCALVRSELCLLWCIRPVHSRADA